MAIVSYLVFLVNILQNYLQKKAIVTITPVVKYAGGEKAMKPVILVGEKAVGSGQKISYEKGGTFSYTSEKFAYEPAMKVATVELRAQGAVKKKNENFHSCYFS